MHSITSFHKWKAQNSEITKKEKKKKKGIQHCDKEETYLISTVPTPSIQVFSMRRDMFILTSRMQKNILMFSHRLETY